MMDEWTRHSRAFDAEIISDHKRQMERQEPDALGRIRYVET
jgi:hypothetical protein